MTSAEIDIMWNRALAESVAAGEEFTRHRFAAMVERETARKCADIIAGQGKIGGPRWACAEIIKKEFPEAFE